MYNFILLLLRNFTLTFFFVGLVCSAVAIYRNRDRLTKAFVIEAIFKYYCFWAQGICWTYNGVMHVVFHKMAAGFIGWTDSPFQIELGVASLSISVVSLVAIKKDFGLRVALVISTATFLWSAATGYVYQILSTGNYAAGNAGVMLWTGLLMPVISTIVLRLSYLSSKTLPNGLAGLA